MNHTAILSQLKSNALFQNLNEEQLQFIATNSKILNIHKNAFIVQEKEIGDEVYFILEGEANVLKKDEKTGDLVQISVLKPGDLIGEMAMIDHSPRSASVKAGENLQLLLLPLNKSYLLPKEKIFVNQIISNISQEVTKKLRFLNEVVVKTLESQLENEKIRVEIGRFFFTILITLSTLILLVSITQQIKKEIKHNTFLSMAIIIFAVVIVLFYYKKSIYPPQYFGITLTNWKRNLIEGILFTLPILIFVTIVKWFLIQDSQVFKGDRVISFITIPLLTPIVYMTLVPLQEFLVRGILQSFIKGLLSNHTVLLPIILSNLLFSAVHAHISIKFAMAAFIYGCFWGWLRAYQNSLIGPIISHILIGVWCLFILNLGKILNT